MQGGVNYNGSTLLTGGINVNTTGNIQALNVQITENGERTITPPEGVDGYAPITIDTNVPIPEPVLDTLNVTSNGTYTPPSGVDGYDEVNVNVPQPTPVLDDITITANGTYTPPSGVDGYDEITVNVSQDADIQPLTRTITTNGTTVINASDLNVDGFNPVTITTAVDGYTIKTLANTPLPIATFNGTSNPLKSLTASIVPVQAGSGDPSPTNVRPISGWTEDVVTVTDDLQNPTVTHTTTIPFTDSQGNPVEVYGGSVDVVNGGEQPRTLGSVDLGELEWVYDVNIRCWNITIQAEWNMKGVSNNQQVANATAEQFKLRKASGMSSSVAGELAVDVSMIRANTGSDNEAPKGLLVYELATPTTFYTQPTSIKSLDGENNVFASTGDVEELKYFADL